MQSGFSIRIAGTCPARPSFPPPWSAGIGLPVKRVCRGVRLLVWEALVLASGQMAELRDRRRIACHVRQIAMYVCHVALRIPMAGIAEACGRDPSTVSHACHLTEDRRDDALFDAFVACVERMALAALAVWRVSVMPEQMGGAGGKAGRKMLLKLLRMVLRGECRIVAEDAHGVRIERESEGRESEGAQVDPAVISAAVSRGLVLRKAQRLLAMPAASAFLRRALSGGDETFSHQHREMVEEEVLLDGARQAVRRNLKESPLAPLARLKDRGGEPFLSAAAFDAGEKLAADFSRGQMQPRITACWEPRLETGGGRRGAGGAEISDGAMAARDRFASAVEAMGPELAGVAVDVCCFAKGLETVERERLWPARSAKLMLRTALLALARHYAPPVAGGRRKHHWGDGDFRPRM